MGGRRQRGAWAAACLVVGLAGTAAAAPPEVRQVCLDTLTVHLERSHIDPSETDVEEICEGFLQAIREGLPRASWPEWMRTALLEIDFGFAPKGARHDPSARYRYPYQVWMPRAVGQGPGGWSHNTPAEQFAYDFLMPIGTPVLAARAGVVARVQDGSHARNVADRDGDKGNAVTILHEDGTFALYVHLEPGIPVGKGQRVRRGQRIGLSGNTGFAGGPHLHFVVRSRRADGEVVSHRTLFGKPGSIGADLEEGHHYGSIPRSKRPLRVRVDGVPVTDGETVKIPRNEEAKIEVRAGARDADVTLANRVRYENMTIWTLDTSEPGHVRAEPMKGMRGGDLAEKVAAVNVDEGLVFVYHGVPRDPDFGLFQIRFEITE